MNNELINDRNGLVEDIGAELRRVLNEVLDERGIARRPASKEQTFDIERVKKKTLTIFQTIVVAAQKKELLAMREEIAEERAKFEHPERNKSAILENVLKPRIMNRTIKRMPTAAEAEELFADLLGGLTKQSYNPFRRDMEGRYCWLSGRMKRYD